MAPNGDRPASIWGSPTKSVVTICRSLREPSPRGLSIAVRIVIKSFREFAVCAAQSPVLPVAANTTAATSIRGFDSSSGVLGRLSCEARTHVGWRLASAIDYIGRVRIPYLNDLLAFRIIQNIKTFAMMRSRTLLIRSQNNPVNKKSALARKNLGRVRRASTRDASRGGSA